MLLPPTGCAFAGKTFFTHRNKRAARRADARRAEKINPRALRGKREQSPPRSAEIFFLRSLALRRRLSSLRAGRHRKGRAPNFPRGGRSFTPRAARLSLSMPIPPKRLAPTFPRSGRSFTPRATCLSSPHADPAKEARADLPAGRAVAPVPCVAPGRTKKRSRSSVFLLSVYSLEPVSISEPMIIFWKIANRMMTGRTHMTAAAMTGPWF